MAETKLEITVVWSAPPVGRGPLARGAIAALRLAASPLARLAARVRRWPLNPRR